MSAIPDARTIPQLLGDSLAELAKLIQKEAELARAELGAKVETAGGAVKLIAAGAVLMIPALVLILFAISSELIQLGLSAPLAYLCSGLAAAVIAFVLVWSGLGRLSGDALKPAVTLDEIRRDKLAAQELMR
jgi:hypothetical protein